MRYLVLLALLSGPVFAGPSCWPSPTSTVAGQVPSAVSENTHYVIWKCPDGSVHSLTGSWAEATQWASKYLAGLNDTEAMSAWDASRPQTNSEKAFLRRVAVDSLGVQAISLDGIAYKQRLGIDTTQFIAIGKVASGTQCPNSGYAVVPRSAVTLATKYDTLPLVVYANCG